MLGCSLAGWCVPCGSRLRLMLCWRWRCCCSRRRRRSCCPTEFNKLIGLDGVDDLLGVLANTLLAVAIFSLGIMVSSLQAAASAATPRARPLLMQDRTAQNAISVFIGGFIFAIVGTVGLSTNYYDAPARVILFLTTCLVIVVGHLRADPVDRAAEQSGRCVRGRRSAGGSGGCKAFADLARRPLLGGVELTDAA